MRTAEDLTAAAGLFECYAAALPIDLGYQGFASELAGLPGKYAPPTGELLLARGAHGTPLGCVGLRSIPPAGCCEMKRLYVSPDARGLGLGRTLAEAAAEAARRLGYQELRLDTLRGMGAAIHLYRQLGFTPIAAYYEGAPAGTMFLRLKL